MVQQHRRTESSVGQCNFCTTFTYLHNSKHYSTVWQYHSPSADQDIHCWPRTYVTLIRYIVCQQTASWSMRSSQHTHNQFL